MPARAARPAVRQEAQLVPGAQVARVAAVRVAPLEKAALVVREVQRAKLVPPAPRAVVARLAAQAAQAAQAPQARLALRAAERMAARPMPVTHRRMFPST
jgi:hypothetical protein